MDQSEQITAFLQNFLICIEMPIIAVLHCFAFGHEQYAELLASRFPLVFALRDVFGTNDVYIDSRETFFRKKIRPHPIKITGQVYDKEMVASARYRFPLL